MAPDQRGAAQRDAWVCFLDESGVSLRPPVRRTWAPRGQTPIVRHHGHWKRASMAGICCYAPGGSRARLCFHTQPASYNAHTLIEVLKRLRRFLRGRPAVLVWDNLPAHHSQVMCDWLTSQRHWLQVEYLPAYAHDLDPVEGLWANLKGAELANLARDTVAEVLAAAQQGVARVRREPALLFSFLQYCGLDL
jgi:transposase